MRQKKSNKNFLRLTPTEAKLLDLKRQGKSEPEICKELGWKGKSHMGNLLATAIEKERLLILDPPNSQGGTSSLKTARGNIRMKGTK